MDDHSSQLRLTPEGANRIFLEVMHGHLLEQHGVEIAAAMDVWLHEAGLHDYLEMIISGDDVQLGFTTKRDEELTIPISATVLILDERARKGEFPFESPRTDFLTNLVMEMQFNLVKLTN